MATIKSYTDLEQSKKLAEILPIESADMKILPFTEREYRIVPINDIAVCGKKDEIYAWSLAALLKILAKIASKIDDDGSANLSSFIGQWSVNMFDCPVEATDNYDNPVDACVAMIEKLYKLKLL